MAPKVGEHGDEVLGIGSCVHIDNNADVELPLRLVMLPSTAKSPITI